MGDQFGSGIYIQDDAVHISGVANIGKEYSSSAAESFVLRYAQPPGTEPVWSRSVKSGTILLGIASTDEGVYAAGDSFYLTTGEGQPECAAGRS